jgi:hypothetical protein
LIGKLDGEGKEGVGKDNFANGFVIGLDALPANLADGRTGLAISRLAIDASEAYSIRRHGNSGKLCINGIIFTYPFS